MPKRDKATGENEMDNEAMNDRVSTNERISLPSTSTCQDKYFESGLHDGSLDSDAALIVTKLEITEEEEMVAISNLDLSSISTKISRDPLKWPLEINDDISALTSGGCNDWNHIGERLSSHEKSKAHLSAHKQWTELALRLTTNKTIDANHQRMLDDEARHWQNVLERLLAIIHFLAQQFELISKFDTVISEHLLRIKDGRTQQHYLGKDIQTESIHLLANKIKQTILNIVKNAKYYSIIVDCTSDFSHIEQMTIIIRCVNITKSPVEVRENFLGYLPVTSTTGAALTEVILDELKKNGLTIDNLRGQGYDNGSNMKGKHAGVQQRISEINPLAFFVPSSPLRWDVLKKYTPSLTVKPLSTTRWESRIDAIRPIRYQIGEIYDALLDISSNDSFDAMYLESYRSDDGFASTISDAKELAEILGVESDFKSAHNVRPRRQKRQFDYESEDQAVQDPKTRLKTHNSHFSFLYDISALKHMLLTVLLDNCTKLETFSTDQDLKDIDAQQLLNELQVLSHSVDETVSLTPLNV
ncbi:uncharacterized protein LOC117181268 [Belonocnema kinseyi]|uniref:uncharacterized protein LOC117181268 n=1 Tax=Belonocnema kinseyi TaxID=2817044 RepID=UPI00143CDF10|nr:uncharacterized protein LOC117181268 [Belonocnema kinseyi]